jgi:hypothetical protein
VKQAALHICALALLSFALAPLMTAYAQPSPATTGNNDFSIIWITDTQYLAESNPAINDNLSRWIVQNSDAYNLKMVIHTGDLVNSEANRTQWLNANQSMGILLDAGVPYCWAAGNHDFNRIFWMGNQYAAFDPEVLSAKSYWVSTEFDGMNNAVFINVSGWECLAVNIAYNANNTVLAWANSVLDAYPQAHAIVATHAYIDKQCRYDDWATNFKNTVLDTHANVFLTLSGHYHTIEGNRTRVGGRDELLFNQQDAYDKLGGASARILTFDTTKGTVNVQTYNLYTDQYAVDSNNDFILNTAFRNDSVDSKSFPAGLAVAGVVLVLAVVGVCVFFVRKRVKGGFV